MGDLLGCCSEFAMRVVRDFSLGEIERVETGMVGDLRVWDLHEGTYTCPPRGPPPLLPLLLLAPRSLLSLAPPPPSISSHSLSGGAYMAPGRIVIYKGLRKRK